MSDRDISANKNALSAWAHNTGTPSESQSFNALGTGQSYSGVVISVYRKPQERHPNGKVPQYGHAVRSRGTLLGTFDPRRPRCPSVPVGARQTSRMVACEIAPSRRSANSKGLPRGSPFCLVIGMRAGARTTRKSVRWHAPFRYAAPGSHFSATQPIFSFLPCGG